MRGEKKVKLSYYGQSIAVLVGVMTPMAAGAGTVFVQCEGCTAAQMQQRAATLGIGQRYVFDAGLGRVRQYAVSNAKADEVSPIDSRAVSVVEHLHEARATDGSFGKAAVELAIPIDNIGRDPSTGESYEPRNVAWANGNFGAFWMKAMVYMTGDEFFKESPALRAFAAALREAAQITGPAVVDTHAAPTWMGAGGDISFEGTVTPFKVKLVNADRSYVLVNVHRNGQLAYAGAFGADDRPFPDHVLSSQAPAEAKQR